MLSDKWIQYDSMYIIIRRPGKFTMYLFYVVIFET